MLNLKWKLPCSGGAGGQNVNKVETKYFLPISHRALRWFVKPSALKWVIVKGIANAEKNRLYEEELRKREELTNTANANKKKIEWGSQICSYVFTLIKWLKIIEPITR